MGMLAIVILGLERRTLGFSLAHSDNRPAKQYWSTAVTAALDGLHLVSVLEDGPNAPFHRVFTLLAKIAGDHVFAARSTDTEGGRISMSNGDHASVSLKVGGSCFDREYIRLQRSPATRTAAGVSRGLRLEHGCLGANNIHPFTERIWFVFRDLFWVLGRRNHCIFLCIIFRLFIELI